MPLKKEITREFILNNAFNFVREKGYQNLTARNLANYMNYSTMPIYSQIESMETLYRETARMSRDLLLEYQFAETGYTPELSLPLGFLRFAIDEKELFKVMMLNDDEAQKQIRADMRDSVKVLIVEYLKKKGLNSEADISRALAKIKNLTIYAQGLAVSYHFQSIELKKTELEEMFIDYYEQVK